MIYYAVAMIMVLVGVFGAIGIVVNTQSTNAVLAGGTSCGAATVSSGSSALEIRSAPREMQDIG
jgi:hypothetical protein